MSFGAKPVKGYYFITDHKLSKHGIMADVKDAVAAGVKLIQYRNKEASGRQMYDEAVSILRNCPNTTFIVNDRIDVAMAVDADGVHIGQEDIPYMFARKFLGKDKIIGVTVHTIEQAREADRLGANYIAVSPVFSTKTKHDAGPAVGLEMIKMIKTIVSAPVVAIGGIDLSNAASVIDAGADSLCAISAAITKDDVKGEFLKFQKLFNL